jgi:hypothetical protein
MRSLWRMIASRWLGGQGSDALTGDSTLLDLLTRSEGAQAKPGFLVRRQSGVSHRAMLSRYDPDGTDEAALIPAAVREDPDA